jgi:hypothetical protein
MGSGDDLGDSCRELEEALVLSDVISRRETRSFRCSHVGQSNRRRARAAGGALNKPTEDLVEDQHVNPLRGRSLCRRKRTGPARTDSKPGNSLTRGRPSLSGAELCTRRLGYRSGGGSACAVDPG